MTDYHSVKCKRIVSEQGFRADRLKLFCEKFFCTISDSGLRR